MKIFNKQGFTLIELVMTMAIIVILSAMAIPAIGRLLQVSSLDAGSRLVQNDIRYAQMLSQTTGDSYGFRATSSTVYHVYKVSDGSIATSPYDQHPLQVDLNSVYNGLHFSAGAYPAYQVTFDAVGRPSVAMTVQVMDVENFQSQNIQISLGSGLVMRNNPTCATLGC